MRKKIVFFTGAGMSRESGLPTFRGDGGIWNDIDAGRVATIGAWHRRGPGSMADRRQAMLDFFNAMRRAILAHEPNEGHRLIAALESRFDVTVVTQNGDDYHTRAGSTDVVYLHGEALKNASSADPSQPLPIDPSDPDIRLGDKAPDGSQLRPYVIYFDEPLDSRIWRRALRATQEADAFVVVGSSMSVFPAADLVKAVRPDADLYVIDPGEVTLPEVCRHSWVHIAEGASSGLARLADILESNFNPKNPTYDPESDIR